MARRREINQVRTDRLEGMIAHYRAMGQTEAAQAIERLARSIGAPLNEGAIERETERRRMIYTAARR